jgi:hypothetical protein
MKTSVIKCSKILPINILKLIKILMKINQILNIGFHFFKIKMMKRLLAKPLSIIIINLIFKIS